MNKFIDNILIKDLPNNLATYLRQIDIAGDFVSLGITINKGSLSESDEEIGVAHFLEHMIIDCSAMNNISFNRVYRQAYTDFFETTYLFNCCIKDLSFCLSTIAKLINGEFIQERDIENVRSHILEEYRKVTNSTDFKIMQFLCENNTQYCSHFPIGTKESIENMTYNKVMNLFDRCYSAQNMALIIVGNIQESTTLELIRNTFSNIRKRKMRDEIGEKYQYSYGKYCILDHKRKGMEIFFCINNTIPCNNYQIIENEFIDNIALDVLEKALIYYFSDMVIKCKLKKFSKSNSFLVIILQKNVSEIEIERFFKKNIYDNIFSIISDVICEYQAYLLKNEGWGINLNSARNECIRNYIYSEGLVCYDLVYSKEREVLHKVMCNDIYNRIIEWIVDKEYKIVSLE